MENFSRQILAHILQYLTISELNVMSKMNRHILKTILHYRLIQRRLNQGQLYLDDVRFFHDKKVTQVCVNDNMIGVITGDGDMYIWTIGLIPKIFNFDGKKVKQLSISNSNMGIITNNGVVYTWYHKNQTKVYMINIEKKVKHICISGYQSGAITEDGSLYIWNLVDTCYEKKPYLIDIYGKKVVQLALRDSKICILTKDGTIYMWGYVGYIYDIKMRYKPIRLKKPTIVNFNDEIVTQITTNLYTTNILTLDGIIYTIDYIDKTLVPSKFKYFHGKNVIRIYNSKFLSHVLTTSNCLYTCGYDNTLSPIKINLCEKKVIQMSFSHSVRAMIVVQSDDNKWPII